MESKEQIIEGLSKLLASSYSLYLKTHNFHWNVTGPMFTTLHTLFMTQYSELALAIDEIAERIRTLGAYAPGSYSSFSKLSLVHEENGRPKAIDMIHILTIDQEIISNLAREIISMAEENKDQATADLCTRRIDIHDKNAWMLRSHLE